MRGGRGRLTSRQNIWLKRKILELREEFNWCCAWCGSIDGLEFAHLEPTGVSGKGRGRPTRYYDVLRHKSSFMLMCFDCHHDFDMFPIVDFND